MKKQKEEAVEKNDIEYMVMPGADSPEEAEAALDLSFATVEGAEEDEDDADVSSEAKTDEAVEADEETDAEVEDEVEAEADEEVEAELEAAPVKTAQKPMVPKARLDEVLAKQKALQKQLDEIHLANEKSQGAPEAYDFDAKEVEYQNMVLDGETAKAVGLRREIRKAEREQLEFEMRAEMAQTVSQDRQMTALQQAANAMEEAYPVFDRNAEEFSEEMTNEVVELRDAFIMKGYEAVDALSKAVRYVVKDHDLDTDDQKVPSLAGTAVKSDELAKKRSQVSKKLRAADAQPPSLPGESSSSHGEKGFDLSSMTEEEFDALPEATLKRLRGDII